MSTWDNIENEIGVQLDKIEVDESILCMASEFASHCRATGIPSPESFDYCEVDGRVMVWTQPHPKGLMDWAASLRFEHSQMVLTWDGADDQDDPKAVFEYDEDGMCNCSTRIKEVLTQLGVGAKE